MRTLLTFFIIVPIFFLSSCKTKSDKLQDNSSPTIEKNEEPVRISRDDLVKNDIEMNRDDHPTTKNNIDKNNMSDRLSKFSFGMFNLLSKESNGKSISFSPVSLNLAFGLVHTGARNETAKELSVNIGFAEEHDIFYHEFGAYHNYLNSFSADTSLEFNLANRIFLEMNYKILKSYEEHIGKYFDGAFERMDFANNAFVSEQKINAWVEEMTRDKIKNLLPRGSIDPLTRIILVNAIYIKSNWKFPFEKFSTIEKDFFSDSKSKIKEKFMIQKREGVRYAEVNNNQIIELEYTTKDLSLLIILPAESNSKNIHSFIPDQDTYTKILKSLHGKEVYMEIPKFKTESTHSLKDPLMQYGIVKSFTDADFSGITGDRDLEISAVIQKVFFEIDEEGSEATAATAIMMRTTSMANPIQMAQPIRFIANRPFIYILKENKFNTPLFIGQFTGKDD